MSAWRDDGEFVYPGKYLKVVLQRKRRCRKLVPALFRTISRNPIRCPRYLRPQYLRLSREQRGCCALGLQLKNREGRNGKNSGVTVVSIHSGKVFLVKDYIFDLGDNFRRNWSAV